jgi:hypothetical protein
LLVEECKRRIEERKELDRAIRKAKREHARRAKRSRKRT